MDAEILKKIIKNMRKNPEVCGQNSEIFCCKLKFIIMLGANHIVIKK